MRILLFARHPAPYRLALWDALARSVDLTVWCYSAGPSGHPWSMEYPPDLDTRVAPMSGAILPGLREPTYIAHGLSELLQEDEPDAIIVSSWKEPASWQVRRYARRRDIPIIVFDESTVRARRFRRGPVAMYRRRFLSTADAVVVASELSAEAAAQDGVAASRIVVADNVVDVDFFARPPDLPTQRSGPHRFICVARLVPVKNHDSLLRAFASIREDDDELWLVGDGPTRGALEGSVRELGLNDHVTFTGHLPPRGVREALWSAQTGVLVSRTELWGMAVNEILAAGLHGVVSEPCGVVPTIRDDPGVYVCAPTASSIAESLAASRVDWSGWIGDPPMRRRTPERAAARFIAAIENVT